MTLYNDNDKNAAAWLRELIDIGALPNGTVDDRDIRDINPREIHGQSHFFAGIGGWAYALELAGWPTARPVWTASLPCQPFSQAGKRRRTEDERHLWPVFRDLVEECRPPTIFGEQVASADGRDWLAAVFDDLEKLGYAVGAADMCASGIGAPHIRQRLYWCANANASGLVDSDSERPGEERSPESGGGACGRMPSGRIPDTERSGCDGRAPDKRREKERRVAPGGRGEGCGSDTVRMEHASRLGECTDQLGRDSEDRFPLERARSRRDAFDGCAVSGLVHSDGTGSFQMDEAAQATGHRDTAEPTGWHDVVYVTCSDRKARPLPRITESLLEPLVDGLPADMVRGGDKRMAPDCTAEGRTMRLRGYGNSIVPQLAAVFVGTVMEYIDK